MEQNSKGKLVIIGGAEDKKGKCSILRKVVSLVQEVGSTNGTADSLVIMTTATEKPGEVGQQYFKLFKALGISEVKVLDIKSRAEANRKENAQVIGESSGIFFTGGDQLKITATLGGTVVERTLKEGYFAGKVIAGTSAGASVMSGTMIVEGNSDDIPKLNTVKMAPGMELLKGIVIDQHFAQRGRIGRLLTAVAQNPATLGVGIDEDTAIIVDSEGIFEVYGSQTVTVIDGTKIKGTNVSETDSNQPLVLTDVGLHILAKGSKFNLENRELLSI